MTDDDSCREWKAFMMFPIRIAYLAVLFIVFGYFSGYGNTAPYTLWGRLICMIYSIVGIPLAMLAIADLGKFSLDGCQSLIAYVKKHIRKKRNEVVKQKPEDPDESPGWKLLVVFTVYVMAGAALIPLWENIGFFAGVYYW